MRNVIYILIIVVFYSCKRDPSYIFEVNDVAVSATTGDKNRLKTDIEFVSIAHADIFGSIISSNYLDNIITTPNGLKIIDNEFLGCSTGWLLNVKNSCIDENYNYQDFISEKDLDRLWDIRKEWSKTENTYSKKIKFFFKTLLKKI